MSDAALAALWVSLQLACLTLLIATPLAIALAWWMARLRWPGKLMLDALILLPLGLPAVVIGFGLLNGLDGPSATAPWHHMPARSPSAGLALYPTGAVLAACLMTTPMMARMLRPVFEAHNPMLLPVARTLGATDWHAWRTVALPLTLPAIGSAMALGFAAAWGESGAVLVLAAGMPGGITSNAEPTVALALWQALAAPGRPPALAWELGAISLGVAAGAVLLSELLRWQWQNRWRGHPRAHL